ncbi:MAG: hypothetical protein C0599_14720 [Salinivirgaceae bacterium]|nr:MAG: hypothetical protein C0599_14720 [Salinivirgaceae bacterium]
MKKNLLLTFAFSVILVIASFSQDNTLNGSQTIQWIPDDNGIAIDFNVSWNIEEYNSSSTENKHIFVKINLNASYYDYDYVMLDGELYKSIDYPTLIDDSGVEKSSSMEQTLKNLFPYFPRDDVKLLYGEIENKKFTTKYPMNPSFEINDKLTNFHYPQIFDSYQFSSYDEIANLFLNHKINFHINYETDQTKLEQLRTYFRKYEEQRQKIANKQNTKKNTQLGNQNNSNSAYSKNNTAVYNADDIIGIWQSSSGGKFEIVKTSEGVKTRNLVNKRSWGFYKKIKDNFYVANSFTKPVYNKWFIGSTITIVNSNNLVIYNNIDKKIYQWYKISSRL